MTDRSLCWSNRLRLIEDYGLGVSLWSCAMFGWKEIDGRYYYLPTGFMFGLFKDEVLDSAWTGHDSKLDSRTFKEARRCVPRLRDKWGSLWGLGWDRRINDQI